jgi:fructokinase
MGGPLYAGVEAGGTKFLCGIGSAQGGSLETITIATQDPRKTLTEMGAFFARAAAHGRIEALGIGSFGPLDLDPASATFGHILRTPKPGWEGTDLLGRLRCMLGVPAAIDTDVNAAAIAEAAAEDVRDLAYVTVGTGIGVGIIADGRPVHGIGHPEAGHMLLRRHPAHEGFPGVCPFHGDCLEGLASGPAILAAWGASLSGLPGDHAAWEVEADYIAQLCAVLFLTAAPERIVLGGGVMAHRRLLPPIRARTLELLGGYLRGLTEAADLKRRITAPSCGEPSGLVGAYMLAERALASA